MSALPSLAKIAEAAKVNVPELPSLNNGISFADALTERNDYEARYAVENTSEPLDGKELFYNAVIEATRALNLSRGGAPFAASLPVQLIFDIVKDTPRNKRGPVDSGQVLGTLRMMSVSEIELRVEEFARRWVAGC